MAAFLSNIVIENSEYLNLRFEDNELWEFYSNKKYKLSNLSKYINLYQSQKYNSIIIEINFSLDIYKKIINNIIDICNDLNINLNCEKQILAKIENELSIMESRKNIGTDIKNYSFSYSLTEKFENFKNKIQKYLIRKLKPQQELNAFFSFVMQKSCNFSVPGAGKTTTTLAVYAALYSQEAKSKLLVICPKNSFDSWINEWTETFGNKILLKKQVFSKSYENIQFYRTKNLILVNYENVNSFISIAHNIIIENTLVVFDEVHKIKNPEGTRASKWIKIIEQNDNAGIILLTGTPIPNSYKDTFNYAKLIFGNEMKNFFPYDINLLDAISKNNDQMQMKEINTKLYPFFIRTSKSDLNIKPPLNDLIHTCQANEEELKLFKEINNNIDNPLQKIILLLQLESNPYLISEKTNMFEIEEFLEENDIMSKNFENISFDIGTLNFSSKFLKAINVITKLIEQGKKVILWCIFVKTIELFNLVLNNKGIKSNKIFGAVNEDERIKIINSFKNGDFDVLITNPHTLAESVSFHKIAHDAIYYDLSYNLVHFLQSKNRIHRIGLGENDYTQYHFITQNYKLKFSEFNLIKRIYERLSFKEKIMNEAIEKKMLEECTFSTNDDIKIIFKNLNTKEE